MDHPLLSDNNRELRRRVIHLLCSAYSVRREGNIVFVCGGNDDQHMRPRFRTYCHTHHPDFHVFLPEYAMKNYFSAPGSGQFDIADFESLVADLSHVIVLFPEAPGSFAETGYFSALPKLASKTILALDSKWQGEDSFISMGPAKKINETSQFSGVMQIDYNNPDFTAIIKRINRIELAKYMKSLSVTTYNNLSNYERFCLIHKIFSILGVARMDDVIFVLRAIFKSRISVDNVKQITSVLVGAEYLREAGPYGHYHTDTSKGELLDPKIGFKEKESDARLEITSILYAGDDELISILEIAQNAA